MVTFSDGTYLTGRYLGRSGERLYLAWPLPATDQQSDLESRNSETRVVVVDNAAVAELRYGAWEARNRSREMNAVSRRRGRSRSGGCVPTPLTRPVLPARPHQPAQ